jgi:hypothetical protein
MEEYVSTHTDTPQQNFSEKQAKETNDQRNVGVHLIFMQTMLSVINTAAVVSSVFSVEAVSPTSGATGNCFLLGRNCFRSRYELVLGNVPSRAQYPWAHRNVKEIEPCTRGNYLCCSFLSQECSTG